MEESILITVKRLLLIPETDVFFDETLLTAINVAFFTLNQIGFGPSEIFIVRDATTKWSDFSPDHELIKTYVGLRVRLIVDPPTYSFVLDSYTKAINEIEWRLNVQGE